MHESEDTCQVFVQMWAEEVTRQVSRVRRTREKADFDWRAAERMEDWSPSELDIAQNFRTQWAEEHTLVWAAHQLERWVCRLAEERGEEIPPRDQALANVRNALEHLDEAEFEGDDVVPGERSRSLRALPKSRLPLQTGFGNGLAFGLIDVKELEDRALAIVSSIEDKLMAEAESWWVEMMSGR